MALCLAAATKHHGPKDLADVHAMRLPIYLMPKILLNGFVISFFFFLYLPAIKSAIFCICLAKCFCWCYEWGFLILVEGSPVCSCPGFPLGRVCGGPAL